VPADVPFVDLRRQYQTIRVDVEAAVVAAMRSGQYVLGPDVTEFEREWAGYCKVAECVGVSSGTAALHLAYEAIGISPGDEVIAQANTFIATIVPLVKIGARPVLVDCDANGRIDPERVAAAVTTRTRAIVGVDLFGHPYDAAALQEIAAEHDLVVVEDAAQAHGARYRALPCGKLGRVAVFSFYPGKNLGAFGDAGAVVTDDPELADVVRVRRDLGQRRKYEHVVVAGNDRLDTLQAAVLRVKLRHLDGWNNRRADHASRYTTLLAPYVETPQTADWAEPSWHLYVVRAANRDALRDALSKEGVASGLHYPRPLHLQPALSFLGHRPGAFPLAEELARTSLSLPMFPELREDEIERVASVTAEVAIRPEPLPARER
jgi:dTDP-4-amino-4,6-dideoxygalactose transaminase